MGPILEVRFGRKGRKSIKQSLLVLDYAVAISFIWSMTYLIEKIALISRS
jgi:hypothetical protein